jgi:hypothetical protein
MVVKVVKRGNKWRIVYSNNNHIAKQKNGKAEDGGGYKTKTIAMRNWKGGSVRDDLSRSCQGKKMYTKKYMNRPGPPYPANDPDCHWNCALGNDSYWYRSEYTPQGFFVWKKRPLSEQGE